MQSTAAFRVAQAKSPSKTPLFGQLDLRDIRAAAFRVLHLQGLAFRLPRHLTIAERQLLTRCADIYDSIGGEFGEDSTGVPIGDLVLRRGVASARAKRTKLLPATRQLRLGDNGK